MNWLIETPSRLASPLSRLEGESWQSQISPVAHRAYPPIRGHGELPARSESRSSSPNRIGPVAAKSRNSMSLVIRPSRHPRLATADLQDVSHRRIS